MDQVHRLAAQLPDPMVGCRPAVGGVADPDRPRAAKAFQVVKGQFDQPLAARPVHDLELLGAAGGAALDEAAEPVGLGGVAELGQRP
jgi:hypothetical protein